MISIPSTIIGRPSAAERCLDCGSGGCSGGGNFKSWEFKVALAPRDALYLNLLETSAPDNAARPSAITNKSFRNPAYDQSPDGCRADHACYNVLKL
jgi:hypothetical protein